MSISVLPEKWCVRINNPDLVSKFLHTKCNMDIGYKDSWDVSAKLFFHYPFFEESTLNGKTYYMHSSTGINSGYTEISFEDFERLVFK